MPSKHGLQGAQGASLLAGLLVAIVCAVLLAGHSSGPIAWAQTTVDYDDDDDGLIEIDTLARLNAIRWDLDGDGTADDSANATSYATAFPDAMTEMGCPSEGCTGYELTVDLDFGGSAWASGAGWDPIGAASTSPFAAMFDGGAPTYTISNLFINRPSSASAVGLFGYTAAGSAIRNVNLEGVDVTAVDYVGALVGQSISSHRAKPRRRHGERPLVCRRAGRVERRDHHRKHVERERDLKQHRWCHRRLWSGSAGGR